MNYRWLGSTPPAVTTAIGYTLSMVLSSFLCVSMSTILLKLGEQKIGFGYIHSGVSGLDGPLETPASSKSLSGLFSSPSSRARLAAANAPLLFTRNEHLGPGISVSIRATIRRFARLQLAIRGK